MSEFGRVLATCGVTHETLKAEERGSLDRDGYVLFDSVVDRGRLEEMRDGFERAYGNITDGSRQSGTRHIPDLSAGGAIFDDVYVHPRILAAVHHVLNSPFEVLLFSGRDPLPGFGQQGLHNDWPVRAASEPYSVATALWLLDDFTDFSGATRVVPGSHLNPRPLPKTMQAPSGRHADEKIIVGAAGSVLVINGHLWHSGTKNRSKSPRRVLQCQYVVRGLGSPVRNRRILPARLTDEARYLLGTGS